jgi:glycosyltransferase involved in cell wall biosynthesis
LQSTNEDAGLKIAVIASSYPRFPGDGTAPFVKSISEHLAKQGHEIEVVAPYDPAVREVDQGRVRVHRFRYIWPESLHIMGHARSLDADVRLRPLSYLLLPFFLLGAFITLMRVTGKQKSQVIHAHWVIPNGLVAGWVASIRKIPFIISLHGSDIYVARKNPLFGAAARWVFHRATGVTACSQELRQAAITLGAPEDTKLLPWGADPDLFHPGLRPAKNQTQLSEDRSRIELAALGRLVHKKGFGTLLAALPDIINKCPGIHLTLGGDGPLKQELMHQAETLGVSGYVTFAGQIPWNQVPELLATSDIFILPSVRDAFGNVDGLPTVLPEAMACGTAVIASDIGGVSLIIHHGHNGLLVPPGDEKILADTLGLLVSDENLRNNLGRSARQSVEQKYNWDEVAKHFTRMFENAAWQNAQSFRLGTIYRNEFLTLLGKRAGQGSVLDVGCHDGYFLTRLDAPLRIGVDPDPIPGAPGIQFVRADGCFLPFRSDAFDHVYALDVIEHIENDRKFAKALTRVLAPGGDLFLSTPSLNIRMFPPFLTRWISLQWGHTLRLGYTPAELVSLFENGGKVTSYEWNAPAYRFWYLPVRLISNLFPGLAAQILRRIARWDFRHTQGQNGFQILEVARSPEPANQKSPQL